MSYCLGNLASSIVYDLGVYCDIAFVTG